MRCGTRRRPAGRIAPRPELPSEHRLERQLERLPERLREVLVLRYYQDLGEAEIAEILDIPRGTVKSRLHAAVRAARALLEKDASHA
jgi:DNA-directed RNA polymerase specialized sigma24 family protein